MVSWSNYSFFLYDNTTRVGHHIGQIHLSSYKVKIYTIYEPWGMNSFMQQIYLKKGTFNQKRGLIEKKWCSISSSNPAVQPRQGETWEQGLIDRPTVKQLKYRACGQWIENLLPRPLTLPNRGLEVCFSSTWKVEKIDGKHKNTISHAASYIFVNSIAWKASTDSHQRVQTCINRPPKFPTQHGSS